MLKDKCLLFVFILTTSPFYVLAFQADEVSTFVSPDSSYEAISEFVDSVDSFLYLSVYQISSPAVGEMILKLLNEGKKVTIIVDDSPAGGISDDELGILTLLLYSGADVRFSGDEFRFHHGKYGVADNETLFLTSENLGRTGFPAPGTKGNRGWGIIIEGDEVAKHFADIFYRDLSSSEPFTASKVPMNPSMSRAPYNANFGLKRYSGGFDVIPVVAPDDAVEKIVNLIDSANSSLYIEQFYIYKYWGKRKTGSVEKTPNIFLEAAIDAARRGCRSGYSSMTRGTT